MSHTNHKNGRTTERRRHARLPMVEGMIEPVLIQVGPDGKPGSASSSGQPAIITNLSAGGMSLLMFLEPPRARQLDMVLSLPGLERVPITGRVVRVHQKGPTYNVGIAFTKIEKRHQNQISRMAEDHGDCRTRIALKLPEVCLPTCTFHALCAKPQKGPYWRKK